MRRRADQGLTLVELLIAMAIMGIVFVLVTNWQVSTLSISTRTNALSQRLSDLTDVTGYVGDRVRSAVRVRVATSGMTVNSGTGNACSNERPCLAVVLPMPSASGGINEYDLYTYRMEPRSVLNEDDRPDDDWANGTDVSPAVTSRVQVLREYRTHSASTPATCQATPAQFESGSFVGTSANVANCTAMRDLASLGSVGSTLPYLVSDYLTPANELKDVSGANVPAFSLTSGAITLRFQSKFRVRGATQLLPIPPYALTVQARNVAP